MNRREILTAVAGLAAATPAMLRAQKSPAVIGFLGGQANPLPGDDQGNALMQGFRDAGLVLGRDFVFETRFTGGDDGKFPELARELARLKARMILANTPAGARAAQRLDPPVPVLLTLANDPVGAGLIDSLAHPGHHTTGTATLAEDLTPKVLEFIREILPNAARLVVLFNPLNPSNAPIVENLQAKARSSGIELSALALKPSDDLDALFEILRAHRPDAIQIISDPAIIDLRRRLTDRAAATRLPIFGTSSIMTESGGLLSYGVPINKMLARMGYYVKRIMDGANAGDLPVEQPTEVTLIINLKSAKTLGIDIPATLLSRADTVIE